MIQPAKSNPIPQSTDLERHILPDKSLHPAYWSHLELALDIRRGQGLNRNSVISQPLSQTIISRNGKEAINFGANDYLGLTWHPEVRQAAFESSLLVQKFGSGASPLVTGQTLEHARLVQSIAGFEETESAIVFSSGFAANVGTVASLATKDDIIFSDGLNHASLIDGCRLSRAQLLIYPHCDMAVLRELVREHRHRGRFAFVATDSVFSMGGDLTPLVEINTLCHEFDMQCILDEAHATGVYGENGRGLVEHASVSSERIVSIGTLSKAVGCVGGFVSGSRLLIEWLTNHARSWIYSTALPIPIVAAACKAITLVRNMGSERRELAGKAIELRSRLTGLGFEVGSGDSPIVPIYINDTKKVMELSERLFQMGVFVPAIRPPTVPKNRSLLRVSLSIEHSKDEINRLVEVIAREG